MTLNIEGRYPGGGQDGHSFAGNFPKIIQQGRFARTGLSGNKKRMVRVLHQVQGLLELWVELDRFFFRHGLFWKNSLPGTFSDNP